MESASPGEFSGTTELNRGSQHLPGKRSELFPNGRGTLRRARIAALCDAWGIDSAGSLSDAGGVGALLQFVNSTTGAAFMPSYDGNGNVASLTNLGSGALAAAYEYSPYGEMLRDDVLDNAASTFAFEFSTKWRDAETGWSNYGRRYYDLRNRRFAGRDPIAGEGVVNVHGFVGSNPLNRWDYLGMSEPTVLSTACHGVAVKNAMAIPSKDLQEIRGCFGNGRL